ncbi:MAG: hypothetical protein J0L56_09025 [Chitinophagales bacterium]|nr:hypothetical protein [Chitinophagales bacterium]
MSNNLVYRTLFEVKILHHYFLNKGTLLFDLMDINKEKKEVLKKYDIRNFLHIEPTEACKRILKQYRCIFKLTPTGFLIGLRAEKTAPDKYKPVFKPEDTSRFSFLVYFTDTFFINYTALPMQRQISDLTGHISPVNTIFYCQNLTGGSPKKYPYLSKIAATFQNGQTASAGDIIADNDNTATRLFIAKKITNNAPPHADWTNDTLVNGQPLHYTGISDLVPVFTDLLRFNSGKEQANITVTITNAAAEEMPVKTEFIKDKKGNDPEKIVVLAAIHLLPEGLYTAKFEDAAINYKKEFRFFRTEQAASADMIIDLFLKSDSALYDMTDNTGVLKDPVYEIRFMNRMTVWQYRGDKFTDTSVTGPHPLTRLGYINAVVKDKNNNDVDDLPNPSVQMVKTTHPPGTATVYNTISEIFIH